MPRPPHPSRQRARRCARSRAESYATAVLLQACAQGEQRQPRTSRDTTARRRRYAALQRNPSGRATRSRLGLTAGLSRRGRVSRVSRGGGGVWRVWGGGRLIAMAIPCVEGAIYRNDIREVTGQTRGETHLAGQARRGESRLYPTRKLTARPPRRPVFVLAMEARVSRRRSRGRSRRRGAAARPRGASSPPPNAPPRRARPTTARSPHHGGAEERNWHTHTRTHAHSVAALPTRLAAQVARFFATYHYGAPPILVPLSQSARAGARAYPAAAYARRGSGPGGHRWVGGVGGWPGGIHRPPRPCSSRRPRIDSPSSITPHHRWIDSDG